jgi:hypothetical protein
MFKRLLVAAAFVTIVAAPAFALWLYPEIGTGNVFPFAYAPTDHGGNDAVAHHPTKSAYAQTPVATGFRSTVVIGNGKVVGHDPDPDPDPFIRLILKEEAKTGQP